MRPSFEASGEWRWTGQHQPLGDSLDAFVTSNFVRGVDAGENPKIDPATTFDRVGR
jgi:hypothetical protein